MLSFKDILDQYKEKLLPEKNTKTERQEILSKIISILEEDRKKGGYKSLSAGTYAIKMAQAGIKSTNDLYWFHSYLLDSKNYSATWWWYIREKKIKK